MDARVIGWLVTLWLSMRDLESVCMGASKLSVRQHKVPPSSSSKWDQIDQADESQAEQQY